jgi:glycosyltransferase involved in cell wall biosynthesis
VPVVWQILDSRTPRPLRAALMPLVTRLADAALFTGNALIELHMGSEPPAIPCLTYFAPVDTMHFRPSVERRAATRARLGIPSDAPVVGIVANLNPQKGIEYFVRAAAEIYQELPDSFFLLVGPRHETHRDYAALLDAEVRRSGVPVERFIFTGDRADVENYYPAMDLKLVTSLPQSEGTTTAAMEALACGVPVITTDVGAQREVVEDGVTGCVVPPLAPARIAEAALRLLVDPALLARMGAAARRQAVARFDVEVCADAHVRAFDVALAHHREKPPAGTDGVSPARRAAAGETPSVPGSSSLAAPSSAEGRRAETVSAPNAPSARGELVRADGSADRGSG